MSGEGDSVNRLALRVILEAAYDQTTGTMSSSLDLPAVQPFGYLGYTGSEEVDSIPIGAVDWVLISVTNEKGEIAHQEACLVMRNGNIATTEGDVVKFESEPFVGRVIVQHRNHLDIRSVDRHIFHGGFRFIDFRQEAGVRIRFDDGLYGMRMGDANHDQRIAYIGDENDRTAILTYLGGAGGQIFGYHGPDVNMDSVVKYIGENNDRTAILTTLGSAGTEVFGELYE